MPFIPFFVEYPLNFYSTFSRDESIKWCYSGREIGGALQLDINGASYQLFQELGGKFVKQNIESDRIHDRKEDEANLWRVNYSGKLQKISSCAWHEWNLRMSYGKINNYEPLQQQQESGVWKSYGKVLRSTRRGGVCGLDYEYRQLRDKWHPCFSVVSGLTYQYQEVSLLFYPIQYSQPLHKFTLHATLLRNFILPKAFLDCSISGRYVIGTGTILEERNLTSGQSTQEIKLWRNSERLQQNYDYETVPRFAGNISVTYTRKAPLCWFVRLSGGYEHSGACRVNENNREIITCIGLIF